MIMLVLSYYVVISDLFFLCIYYSYLIFYDVILFLGCKVIYLPTYLFILSMEKRKRDCALFSNPTISLKERLGYFLKLGSGTLQTSEESSHYKKYWDKMTRMR